MTIEWSPPRQIQVLCPALETQMRPATPRLGRSERNQSVFSQCFKQSLFLCRYDSLMVERNGKVWLACPPYFGDVAPVFSAGLSTISRLASRVKPSENWHWLLWLVGFALVHEKLGRRYWWLRTSRRIPILSWYTCNHLDWSKRSLCMDFSTLTSWY